jgi:hypothetical protein
MLPLVFLRSIHPIEQIANAEGWNLESEHQEQEPQLAGHVSDLARQYRQVEGAL